MDIPGFNEDMASYIEIIFSLITLDNIFLKLWYLIPQTLAPTIY